MIWQQSIYDHNFDFLSFYFKSLIIDVICLGVEE